MPVNQVILYARDVEATVRFYAEHFGFEASRSAGDRIVRLSHRDGGVVLMIHPAGKGQRLGQATVKLVFDVPDVESFCRDRAKHGLPFGPIHQADGYVFANAKDPSQNSISVSSRAFREEAKA